MRYTLTDEQFMDLLTEYKTIPAIANALTDTWIDSRTMRDRMIHHVKRLERDGKVARIGRVQSGPHNTWSIIWGVID